MEDDFRIEGTAVSAPELVIQVKNIPDSGIDVECEVPMQELDIPSDERFITENATVKLKLHVARARQDFIVTGSFTAQLLAICDRCTEEAPLSISENELFHRYKNNLEQPIDLTEDIREDILLAFPTSFLCSEECLGLCPKCGHNLNQGDCGCIIEEAEPFEDEENSNPWAVFDELKLDDDKQ